MDELTEAIIHVAFFLKQEWIQIQGCRARFLDPVGCHVKAVKA